MHSTYSTFMMLTGDYCYIRYNTDFCSKILCNREEMWTLQCDAPVLWLARNLSSVVSNCLFTGVWEKRKCYMLYKITLKLSSSYPSHSHLKTYCINLGTVWKYLKPSCIQQLSLTMAFSFSAPIILTIIIILVSVKHGYTFLRNGF